MRGSTGLTTPAEFLASGVSVVAGRGEVGHGQQQQTATAGLPSAHLSVRGITVCSAICRVLFAWQRS
jgi:hypothetical protein